jgi:hypothetical protein
MSEVTDPRDERATQLVDEPAEQAKRPEQDLGEELVSDQNEDGTVDTVTDDGGTAVDSKEALRADDAADSDAGVVDAEDVDAAERAADADRAATDVGSEDIADTADEAAADEGTADVGGERDELMPGEMAAEPVGSLWSSETAGTLRSRWQELQLRFVDDPRGVVTEAQLLVGEAVEGLTTSLTDQQRELDGWTAGGDGDTEQLRVALQRYRDFFDRVLGQGSA